MILALALLVTGALAWLAPAESLHRLLAGAPRPTLLALEYYRLLSQRHPHTTAYRLAWAEKLIEAGRFREALPVLEPLLPRPQAVTLYLAAAERLFFALPPSERQHIPERLAWLAEQVPLPAQTAEIARSATRIGTYGLAVDLYRAALQKEQDPAARRRIYLAMLRTALATGDPRHALRLAVRHLPYISADYGVYRFLTTLSLSAVHYRCAVHFARLLVELPESGSCTVE